MNRACRVFLMRNASLRAYAYAAISLLLDFYDSRSNVVNVAKLPQAVERICGRPLGELARTVARALSVTLEGMGVYPAGHRRIYRREDLERALALLTLSAIA